MRATVGRAPGAWTRSKRQGACLSGQALNECQHHVTLCMVANAAGALRRGLLTVHVEEGNGAQRGILVERPLCLLLDLRAILYPASIERAAGKARNGRMHSVLHLENVHRVSCILQALEQASLEVGSHCTLTHDRRWQLHGVSNHVNLHQKGHSEA